MKQEITHAFRLNADGKPAGGTSDATGMSIQWQNGPLGRGDERQEPNGAFVETLTQTVIDRINWYQANGFACRENALAITKLEEALHWMNHRTQAREARGVEGTHEK